MRENRMSGSMRGRWCLGMRRLVRHRRPKGAATDRPALQLLTPVLYSTLYRANCPISLEQLRNSWTEGRPVSFPSSGPLRLVWRSCWGCSAQGDSELCVAAPPAVSKPFAPSRFSLPGHLILPALPLL